MITVFRPNDFTKEGLVAFKECGKLNRSHLRYNFRVYLDRTDEAYYSDKDEGEILQDMKQVKMSR